MVIRRAAAVAAIVAVAALPLAFSMTHTAAPPGLACGSTPGWCPNPPERGVDPDTGDITREAISAPADDTSDITREAYPRWSAPGDWI